MRSGSGLEGGGVIVNEETIIGTEYLALTIGCCILVVYLSELIFVLEKKLLHVSPMIVYRMCRSPLSLWRNGWHTTVCMVSVRINVDKDRL